MQEHPLLARSEKVARSVGEGARGTQVHIVVATPGRVLDLANKGVAKLKDCHTFVMDEVPSAMAPDPPALRPCNPCLVLSEKTSLLLKRLSPEISCASCCRACLSHAADIPSIFDIPSRVWGWLQADKLLSPEFQPVIEQLIAHVKPDRQIMLYSATFPVTVKQFKDRFLNKPYIVNLMEELTLKGITQASTPGLTASQCLACSLLTAYDNSCPAASMYRSVDCAVCSITPLWRKSRRCTASTPCSPR